MIKKELRKLAEHYCDEYPLSMVKYYIDLAEGTNALEILKNAFKILCEHRKKYTDEHIIENLDVYYEIENKFDIPERVFGQMLNTILTEIESIINCPNCDETMEYGGVCTNCGYKDLS